MAITRAKSKEEKKKPSRMEATPVKTTLTEKQQFDYLTYLSLAALDVGLETGFKDGPMRDRGGVLSVTAQRIGAVKEDGKNPILSQEDAMYEVNYEAKSRTKRKGKGQMERKMRRLMRSIMAGKPPSPTSRRNYFSFGKGKSTQEAIALAKQAKAILEASGFEVVHKPGTRGIHIVGFAKNAGSTVTSLQKYVRKKAMQEVAAINKAKKGKEQTERDKLMAARKEATEALLKGQVEKYMSKPDDEFDKMFSPDALARLSPEQASERVLRIMNDPMMDDIRRDTLHYLLSRKDVVETLRSHLPPSGKNPFILFTDKEYKQYISFLKGEKRGAVAMRTPGRDYLNDLRTRQRKEREKHGVASVRPWDPVLENAQRLMDGKKAVFIRSSYSSAAQTIATIEQMFPGRSVSYERSPEEVLKGGGHWTITVAARGKRAPTHMNWFQKNFTQQLKYGAGEKDTRFTNAVRESLAGGKTTVNITTEPGTRFPRWMASMLDRKKSTKGALVLKTEYWTALQAKGIVVDRVIRGIPVYASERDRKKGKPPKYYTFKFTLSGEKFSKNMEIARADVREKYGPIKKGRMEPGTAVARRKKSPAAKELTRIKEKAEAQFAESKKKGKKKGPKKV